MTRNQTDYTSINLLCRCHPPLLPLSPRPPSHLPPSKTTKKKKKKTPTWSCISSSTEGSRLILRPVCRIATAFRSLLLSFTLVETPPPPKKREKKKSLLTHCKNPASLFVWHGPLQIRRGRKPPFPRLAGFCTCDKNAKYCAGEGTSRGTFRTGGTKSPLNKNIKRTSRYLKLFHTAFQK